MPGFSHPFASTFDFFSLFLPGGFPGGSVVKNLPANSGDMGLIPG